MAQIEIKKEDAKRRNAQEKYARNQPSRPQSASNLSVTASTKQIHTRPKTAQSVSGRSYLSSKNESYQKQVEASQRLSRPKTAKAPSQRFNKVSFRPKSAMASIGKHQSVCAII